MDLNVWIGFIGFTGPVGTSCERGSEHLERNDYGTLTSF
jgi:hypothetical protein